MVTKILNTIEKNNMLSSGDKVLVAFSGGADSTVLLDALVRLSEKLKISVSAAHLNHMLRGVDSLADEEFARMKCEGYGIELLSERADVEAFAKREGQSVELAARNVRYDFLSRAKKALGANKIATAHNANDNLETILFNISRGSGIDGICGIPPVRDDIIRPLIEVTRQEIEVYAKDQNLSFCIDKTNFDTVYSRNKLRHEALPALVEVNFAAVENAARMSELLREDALFLKRMAEDAAKEISLSATSCMRKELLSLNNALFGRVCEIFAKNALKKDNYTLFHKHVLYIKKLCEGETPSGEICLPEGLSVRCEYEKLVFEKCSFEETLLPKKLLLGENKYGSYTIFLKKLEKCGKINNSVNTFAVSCDKIVDSPVVRTRQEGDKIKLWKRPEKSIKKLFVDERVPRKNRDMVPVIADSEKVIAVFGFGCDERCLPQEEDACFEIKIERTE